MADQNLLGHGINHSLQMLCPTHNKKLEPIGMEEIERKPCDICGRDSTHYCKSCKYVQCDHCRVCSQKHFLIKIVELNKVKTEYYNNGYACNACSKSKTVDDDGIWHCNQCNYDLCLECAE